MRCCKIPQTTPAMDCRTLWTKVLGQSRDLVSKDAAAKSAPSVVADLKALSALLQSTATANEMDSLTFAKAEALAKRASSALSLLTTMKAANQPDEPAIAALASEINTVQSVVEKYFNASSGFEGFLEKIWDGHLCLEDSILQLPDTDGKIIDFPMKTFFHFLMIEGQFTFAFRALLSQPLFYLNF